MLFGVFDGDVGTTGGIGVPDPLGEVDADADAEGEGEGEDGELVLGGVDDELLGGVFGEHDCVGGQ